MRVIGIDVGGTNTDAVLLDDRRVLDAVKRPTTPDVSTGISQALGEIVRRRPPESDRVDAVMLGTTQFTNAVAQRRGLSEVAAIRIGLPATAYLEPLVDWPSDLAALVRGRTFMVRGGHEYDGRPIVPFDEAGMRRAAEEIGAAGLTSVAITSVFAPLTAELEQRAAEIVRAACPDARVTLSHRLGRIGLLPRENVTILNASLIDLAETTVGAFRSALRASGLTAPLFLTQNDGTVMHADYAQAFPVYSFASGPTNSMRGAAFLSGLSDAVVVDVGGTTTDVGCLRRGFPREANSAVEIGGVRSLFRMPDLFSIALGGGTRVHEDPLAIGPESVGYELLTRGRAFGGGELTCTDVAAVAGLVDLGDRELVRSLRPGLIEAVRGELRLMIQTCVERVKTDAAETPLIAVGGGAFLIPDQLDGVSEVVRVEHHAVANAVGAAIAQVSGEADRVFQDVTRDRAIGRATELAEANAVEAGANPRTLELVELEDLPLAYLPGNSLRVRAKVVGEIA